MNLAPGELAYQDPDAALVYVFDWRAWLGDATIASSTFIITGPDGGLVQDTAGVLADNQQTRVRISKGTVGETYDVINRIVTGETPPQTDDRSLRLKIIDN